jgi:large subunit ribosomal protein L30
MKMYGVLRIRGDVNLSPKVRTTLKNLRLGKKNTLSVLPETKDIEGMLKTVKDFVTYGKLSEKEVSEIIKLTKSEKEENTFHLHPPRGGFKGSIKKHAPKGALGKRDKLFDLIKRMI